MDPSSDQHDEGLPREPHAEPGPDPDVSPQALGTPDPAPVDDGTPMMDGSGPQEFDDDEM